jgi:hypothetical protein
VQTGCTSTGEQGCSGGVDAPFVSLSLEAAVEREEEREGNSGIGRGDRQTSDGDMSWGVSSCSTVVSCGIYLSGRGGTTSLGLGSGHAPGKDGVGEAADIMKEKVKKESKEKRGKGALSFWDKWHCSIEGLRIPSLVGKNYKVPLTAPETLSAK